MSSFRITILLLTLLSLAIYPSEWSAVISAPAKAESVLVFDPAKNKWVRKEGKKPRPGFGGRAPVESEVVAFQSDYKPGTIVIDTQQRRLYRIEDAQTAMRYGIGVGREGFAWKGSERITRKAEWPSWTPPAEMRKREAANGRILPVRMEGGIENPLGARALYLGNTLYRIHGTNQPWTIGQAVSSGCIRMTNDDVVDLYNKVRVGDLVVVR